MERDGPKPLVTMPHCSTQHRSIREATPRSTLPKVQSGVHATIEPMSEHTYEERVQALEDELDIPTSDVQAIVDADDLPARPSNEAPSFAPAH